VLLEICPFHAAPWYGICTRQTFKSLEPQALERREMKKPRVDVDALEAVSAVGGKKEKRKGVSRRNQSHGFIRQHNILRSKYFSYDSQHSRNSVSRLKSIKAYHNENLRAYEDNLFDWTDILKMVQDKADGLADSDSNRLIVTNDLPDLRLTPQVVERIQSRIRAHFGPT
jgi:hypothetical protein